MYAILLQLSLRWLDTITKTLWAATTTQRTKRQVIHIDHILTAVMCHYITKTVFMKFRGVMSIGTIWGHISGAE